MQLDLFIEGQISCLKEQGIEPGNIYAKLLACLKEQGINSSLIYEILLECQHLWPPNNQDWQVKVAIQKNLHGPTK
jgi:hypothetical protein